MMDNRQSFVSAKGKTSSKLHVNICVMGPRQIAGNVIKFLMIIAGSRGPRWERDSYLS